MENPNIDVMQLPTIGAGGYLQKKICTSRIH